MTSHLHLRKSRNKSQLIETAKYAVTKLGSTDFVIVSMLKYLLERNELTDLAAPVGLL